MRSSDVIRWGALSAITAGAVWIVAFFLGAPESAVTRAVDGIAGLFTVGGLAGFHALQKDYYGLVGRIGFWMVVFAGVTFFLLGIGDILGYRAGEVVINFLAPVSIFGAIIGFGLYGAATLQARVLPRWCGIGIAVSGILFLFVGFFAEVLFGLLWLALGYILWSRRGTSVGQPSRVR